MYYIFSSASTNLYKRGVLETCAFPDDHVLRYRYSQRLIPKDIQDTPEILLHQKCMLVYAYGNDSDSDFEFLPLRHGRIVESNFESGFLSVDVHLGRFVDYAKGSHPNQLAKWKSTIAAHHSRPRPRSSTNEGFFLYQATDLDGCFSHRDREADWQGVIEELHKTPLGDSATYRVLGFFKVTGVFAGTARTVRFLTSKALSFFPVNVRRSSFATRLIRALERRTEKRILPRLRGPDCLYMLPMGGTVVLRVLFYRVTELPAPSRALSLVYDEKAFTSVSDDQMSIESRYDDVRTILSCARLADPTFTSFSIKQKTEIEGRPIWAAEPTFLMLIGPPRLFLVWTLSLFSFGLLCLNLSPSDQLPIAQTWQNLHPWITLLLQHPKPIGTVAVILASWNYLRKFPLK
jgi:hypothetical protein